LLQLLIHESPWKRKPLREKSQSLVTAPTAIVRWLAAKIDSGDGLGMTVVAAHPSTSKGGKNHEAFFFKGFPQGGRVMIDGQVLRKIKSAFLSTYRSAIDLVESNRIGKAALAALRATWNTYARVLHQLWLEVTGFVFLAMAAVGAMAGFREYGRYQSGQATGPGRLVLAVCFTASFAWFGLSSFWRVRRVSKQRN
jgi:hypothetical protein